MNDEAFNKQSSQQERRELRQEEKNLEQQTRQHERLFRRLKNYAGTLLVLAIISYGLYLLAKSVAPKGEDSSKAIPIMEEAGHITNGSSLPKYTSNPPTSGPHYAQTAQSGFREDTISDQNIIHNLEHGDVWISYHPRISDNIKEGLRQFGGAKIIITPRTANETDIAIVAWGRLDTFNIENNVLPVERIKDFIKRYSNKGPEKVPGTSGGI